MVNKVFLLGNLGKDPQGNFTTGGRACCKFSLATTEKWTDGEGNKQERTDWHNVVVWGKSGENCQQYLAKGSKVFIEGSIQTRSYEKDGQTRYITEIVARDVKFLSHRPQGSDAGDHVPPGDGEYQF